MFKRIRTKFSELLGRGQGTPPGNFDPHFTSAAMLERLLTLTDISREELCEIVRVQFGHVDFSAFRDGASLVASMGDRYTIGFKMCARVANALLQTPLTREEIAADLSRVFNDPDVRQLPEVREAERLFAENRRAAVAQ